MSRKSDPICVTLMDDPLTINLIFTRAEYAP